jgi:hypothetical protein
MTVKEVASFLGKRPSWVYNILNKAKIPVKSFLEYPQIKLLVKARFNALGYEDLNYDFLLDAHVVNLVAESPNISSLKMYVNLVDDFAFCKIAVAYKELRPRSSMLNIVHLLSKKLDYSCDFLSIVKKQTILYISVYTDFCVLGRYKLIAEKGVYSPIEMEVGKHLLKDIQSFDI